MINSNSGMIHTDQHIHAYKYACAHLHSTPTHATTITRTHTHINTQVSPHSAVGVVYMCKVNVHNRQ